MRSAKHLGKFLSFVLRHEPARIGLQLDTSGWADVNELLQQLAAHGRPVSFVELEALVRNNDKQRYSFNADKSKIRANQGHSIAVDLDLQPLTPPVVLYHGTASHFMAAIQQQGLQKRSRHHVHLSSDKETAHKVAIRHGKPVILCIAAAQMQQDGYVFYRSDNGVWLTDQVPTRYFC